MKKLSWLLLAALVACGPQSRDDDSGDGSDSGDDSGDDGGDGNPQCGEACANHCPAGTATYLSGVVLAPNGIDPVPGALVYVPITLPEFPAGVACEICGDILGNSAVLTRTAPDGTFRLGPMPTRMDPVPGSTAKVVAQKGRFRKGVDVPIQNWCSENTAPDATFTLPGANNGFDTIPKIAVATGQYDSMECVLRKLGLQDGSFDIYEGLIPFLPGGGSLPTWESLVTNLDKMKEYNIIFINCGNDYEALLGSNPQVKANVEAYVNSGGRLYVTDWSYDYVEQVPAWSPHVDFAPGMSGATPEPMNEAEVGTGGITTEGLVHDPDMVAWLQAVEQRTGDEVISADSRVHIEHFLGGWIMQLTVMASDTVKVWITGQVSGDGVSGDLPLTTTFDVNSCGRVLYSSYHTLGESGGGITPFPDYCVSTTLSPQERVLEFLILHVADCLVVE